MKYLIIDSNGVGYGAQDARKLYVGGKEVQATFGFVRTMRKILKKYPDHKPICLWDSRAQWRYDLFPLYKGNRNVDEKRIAEKEAYQSQKPDIEKALTALGVDQVMAHGAEADDLAGFFSRSLGKNPENEIVLIASDKDWCQLVDTNVSWYCPRTDRHCNYSNFEEFTGFDTPARFVDAKSLTGDGSDNIPGVGGIGDKGVADFLDKYDSVKHFMTSNQKGLLPEKLPAAWRRLADNKAPNDSKKYGVMEPAFKAFVRNKKLMNLMNDWKPAKKDFVMTSGDWNSANFQELCEDLSFNTILTQFRTWVVPFREVARHT